MTAVNFVQVLPTAAVIFCVLGLLTKVVYNIAFHPLSHVRGPFLAKITTKWASYQDIVNDRCAITHNLHLKHGQVIRVGPNELSFYDPVVAKKLYSQSAHFPKAPVYDTLGNGRFPTLFDMRDRRAHRDRRKTLAPAFAKSTVDKSEPEVAAQLTKFFVWLDRKDGVPLNMAMWCRMIALDITGAVFLGEDFGALRSDVPHVHAVDLDSFLALSGLRWQLPWLIPLFGWLPIRRWQDFIGVSERMYSFGQYALSRYLQYFGKNFYKPDDPVYRLLMAAENTGVPRCHEEIGAEVGSVLIAGTDPVGTTLAFATWELGRHPEWQEILRQEFKDAHVSFENGVVPRWSDIEKLDKLNAVFMEGLRLHPSAPGALPRVVPEGGAMLSGIATPAGTIVSCQNYSLHRDPDVFPSPDMYDPNRWLSPLGGTAAMRDSYQPYSTGARMCIGMHVATMVLKMTIAGIVNGWDISVAESTSKEKVSVTDYFAFMPKVGKVELVFKKRPGSSCPSTA